MTTDQAVKNAARVLKKAESATDAPLMAELNGVANTWLRLAQDLHYWDSEANESE